MSTSNIYAKIGIESSEARVSKLTAIVIFVALAAALFFAYQKIKPQFGEHKTDTASDEVPPAKALAKAPAAR